MKKIVVTIFLVMVLLISIYNVSYATSIDDIFTGAENFIDAGKSAKGEGFSWEGITNASDLIYNTLLIIGVIAVVIVGAILGIKFMTSAVEEQAKIKESLIPFVAGAVIIFGAFGIWKLATGILEGAADSKTKIPIVTNYDDNYNKGYEEGRSAFNERYDEYEDVYTSYKNKVNNGTATKYQKGFVEGWESQM